MSDHDNESSSVESNILDAALNLMESSDGRPVAISDIAERAGYALNTVYRRFPGKKHLLRGLAALQMRRIWTLNKALENRAPPSTLQDLERDLQEAVRCAFDSLLKQRNAHSRLIIEFIGHADLMIEFVRVSRDSKANMLRIIFARSLHLIPPVSEMRTLMFAQAIVGNARSALLNNEPKERVEALIHELVGMMLAVIRQPDEKSIPDGSSTPLHISPCLSA